MKKTNFSCVSPPLRAFYNTIWAASAYMSKAPAKLHCYSWLQTSSEKAVILCRYFAFQIRIRALFIGRKGNMDTSWTPSSVCYSTTHPRNTLASTLLIALSHSTLPVLLVSPPSFTPQCFDHSQTVALDSSRTLDVDLLFPSPPSLPIDILPICQGSIQKLSTWWNLPNSLDQNQLAFCCTNGLRYIRI